MIWSLVRAGRRESDDTPEFVRSSMCCCCCRPAVEYWHSWSVWNEKELEPSNDEEPEKDTLSLWNTEPLNEDWFDGSSTSWIATEKWDLGYRGWHAGEVGS
jgi:hypothetical protein